MPGKDLERNTLKTLTLIHVDRVDGDLDFAPPERLKLGENTLEHLNTFPLTRVLALWRQGDATCFPLHLPALLPSSRRLLDPAYRRFRF